MLMPNKRVYIFTECSEKIGLGHISRCCAFYDEFVRRGCDCAFVICAEERPISLLTDKKHCFIHWKTEGVDLSFVNREDIVFADTITATQQEVDTIAKLVDTFAVIDDYQRRSYCNAIVIDWTPGVELSGVHAHNIGKGNNLLLGLRYSVLRPQFTHKGCLRDKCKSITIIMGGSDIRHLSAQLTHAISTRFMDKDVHVVIGPLAESFETKESNVILHHALSADDLARLFGDSDVVVSAGGQTLFELAAMQIPTIGIQVVDNQTEDILGLQKLGFLKSDIQWNSVSLVDEVLNEIDWFLTSDNRKVWRNGLRYGSIGHGLDAIVDTVLNV